MSDADDSRVAPTPEANAGNILIVDDTPANLRLLSRILAGQGFRVRVATGGDQALSLVQLALPDVILLDVMMPDMNGHEVCRHLKSDARTQAIPVLFLSALSSTADKLQAFNVGGADYITKPFQAPEVLARVRTQLARYRAETELRQVNERLQAQLAEIQALQAQLREQAIRDSLTGLFNRRYLEETLERELLRARREACPISLIMLDIDHFKKLNDTHGHKAGDMMLQRLGEMLRTHTRGSDVACRYGGEEFVAVLPGASLEHAHQRAEQWRATFEQLRVPFGLAHLQATLSLGVAVYPLHGATSDEVLRVADTALYMAKTEGRNQVVVAEL